MGVRRSVAVGSRTASAFSWQIVPTVLPKLLGDRDPAKAQRVMQAMLGMSKLDIAGLEAAHAGRPRDATTT